VVIAVPPSYIAADAVALAQLYDPTATETELNGLDFSRQFDAFARVLKRGRTNSNAMKSSHQRVLLITGHKEAVWSM
jgi:hypothetical protein